MFTKAGFEAAFAYWPMFLEGVLGTVLLSAFAVFFGFIIAMMLALCRMCKGRAAALAGDGLCRGLPRHANAGAGAAHL